MSIHTHCVALTRTVILSVHTFQIQSTITTVRLLTGKLPWTENPTIFPRDCSVRVIRKSTVRDTTITQRARLLKTQLLVQREKVGTMPTRTVFVVKAKKCVLPQNIWWLIARAILLMKEWRQASCIWRRTSRTTVPMTTRRKPLICLHLQLTYLRIKKAIALDMLLLLPARRESQVIAQEL